MTTTETQSIIDATRLSTRPVEAEPGRVYLAPTQTSWTVIDLTGDSYLGTPKRKTGVTVVEDVYSFAAYWAKHHSDGTSEVYADVEKREIIAVLDAHSSVTPGWGGHRLSLALRHSAAFKAWYSISGSMVSQLVFAEFIEDHRADIIDPDAAEVLELATNFQATMKAEFESGTVLKSGTKQLAYVETVQASAGRGKLSVPDYLVLQLPVFDHDAQAEAVTARLRYRISDGKLFLGVILDQADEKVRAAFDATLKAVEDQISYSILRGRPAR